MDYELLYKVDACIKLSVMDLAAISELAQQHYSADCREAVGEQGFITILHRNILAITDDITKPVECDIRRRELDTICKICESSPVLFKQYNTILTAVDGQICELNGYRKASD